MGNKGKILIIDDEEILRENLKYVLESKGYDVLTAIDGADALRTLEKHSPDLIILDMNMPNMGGIEFYQRICYLEKPRYPVFVLTARANMEQLFKGLDVKGFMAKPFEIDDFVNRIGSIIEIQDPLKDVVKDRKRLLLKRVYLAEDDPEESAGIAQALLESGYQVACAKSGTAILEMISIDAPVLGLVKLSLPDLTGDLVALRTLFMEKSSGVKVVLYQKRDAFHVRQVQELIGSKSGVVELIEYDKPTDLIRSVDEAIQNIE